MCAVTSAGCLLLWIGSPNRYYRDGFMISAGIENSLSASVESVMERFKSSDKTLNASYHAN